MTGRFAPSPTGDLHLGNLRTGMLAWLIARSADHPFVVRMEDLDRVTSSADHERRQLEDLAAIGLDWDGPVVRQSERFDRYHLALAQLTASGLTYECYCSRREIREAAAAPHGPGADGRYPGTCRDLSDAERSVRRRERPPAIRFRAAPTDETVIEDLLGAVVHGVADDVALRRNDGVPAYHLAVVVDDAAQGITTVVRGDDLLASCASQRALQHHLGLPGVAYAHVPLVVGPTGDRLAKRDGAVTVRDLATTGVSIERVRAALARSLAIDAADDTTPADLVACFDLVAVRALGREPVEVADLQRSLT